MENKVIDIPIPGEPKNTLVIRFRRRNDGADSFQARRIIPNELRKSPRNPYKTKSLNTTEIDTAKLLAIQWERTLFARIEQGSELFELPFNQIAKEYLRDAERRTTKIDSDGNALVSKSNFTRDKSVINRYLIPFFGNTNLVNIDQRACDRYLQWRKDYYFDGPGVKEDTIQYERQGNRLSRPVQKNNNPAPSTINKDAVAFNKVIQFARVRHSAQTGQCGKIVVPKVKSHRARRRPRFHDDELDLLISTLTERCVESTGRTTHCRHMLWGFVELLLGTGIRVSEAQWLKIKHLELRPRTKKKVEQWETIPETWEDEDGLIGYKHSEIPVVDGTPGSFRIRISIDNPGLKHPDHARLVVPTHYYSEVLVHHLQYLSGHLSKISQAEYVQPLDLDPEQFLFINYDGSRTKSFANGFQSALDAAQSKKHPQGLRLFENKRRSLTSLRHTYASKQIEAGATAGGLGFLADNMGTSPDMLRKHYGQALHELKADDLQIY